ncbi:MAG: ParE toxin of type toxin-antitoxin system, parDE [Bacteroidota bacterium]|jgi:toxin ParE1/3/4
MKIVWSDEAVIDVKRIFHFLQLQGFETFRARTITRRIAERVDILGKFPMLGAPIDSAKFKKGSRRIVDGPYWIIYSIVANDVHIEAVFDCRQDPGKFRL